MTLGAAVLGEPLDATLEASLRAADMACYMAKEKGRNRVQVYHADDSELSLRFGEMAWVQRLHMALEENRFCLYSQEITALGRTEHDGGHIEILLRLHDEAGRMILPDSFIPAAERTGLIVPLGAQILEQACRQQAAWIQAGLQPVPVAVNVSPVQLLEAQFPARVLHTLKQHAVPPAAITLEITESAAVTHMEQALVHIRQLREQGVAVALDDFGTGFSSLNMLRSLPLQTVKIDRSLVDPMPEAEAVAVVRAICDLASALRLDVVAEGVESPEHAQSAREAGCQALQGFLYARPLEVSAATDWLRAAQLAAHGPVQALISGRLPTSV